MQKAYREEHVLLVLVDGPGVRHRVRVFDHRDGFTWKRPEARGHTTYSDHHYNVFVNEQRVIH